MEIRENALLPIVLADTSKRDWYSAIFLSDFTAKTPMFCPVLLDNDDLPGSLQYETVNDVCMRDYFVRKQLGTFANVDEAWEVLEVCWASDEASHTYNIAITTSIQRRSDPSVSTPASRSVYINGRLH
jgi:hypothetical protein